MKVKTWKIRLNDRAEKLKSDIPAVFLALKKKDTPLPAKLIAGLTVIYALSPIDLIPDFIPVLGYLDDIILLPALVALTLRLIPDEIMNECRYEAAGLWKDKRPKRWYYAILFVLLWVFLLLLIVFSVIR